MANRAEVGFIRIKYPVRQRNSGRQLHARTPPPQVEQTGKPKMITGGCYPASDLWSAEQSMLYASCPEDRMLMMTDKARSRRPTATFSKTSREGRPVTASWVMIAEVAKLLAGPSSWTTRIRRRWRTRRGRCGSRGTGTGKTVSYLPGAIPIAKHLGKTAGDLHATVALQEPDRAQGGSAGYPRNAGLNSQFSLAKGAGRLCVSVQARTQLLSEKPSPWPARQQGFCDEVSILGSG